MTSNIRIESFKNDLLDICIDTIKKGKQAIVFMNSKKSAEKQSEDLSKFLKKNDIITTDNKILYEISQKILGDSATKQCQRLSEIIEYGVAFHHSGLKSNQRELIEDEFRNNNIKIIFSTPTLAAGINLPAYRAIIQSVKRFNGISGRQEYIPTLEYLQMAGRAGRPDFEEKIGEAIIVVGNEKEDLLIDKYIFGVAEDISSKLGVEPILRFQMLSVTTFINDFEEIKKFFLNTFYGYQFGDEEYLEFMLRRIINNLKDFELIEEEENKINQTILGNLISKLYIDPITSNKFVNFIKKYKEDPDNLIDFSLLQIICNTFEMRPFLNIKDKNIFSDYYNEYEENLYQEVPDVFEVEFDDYFKSFNVACVLYEWINEQKEDYLMEKYGITPGDLNNKLYNGDWVLYSLQEISRLYDEKELYKKIDVLRKRLKYGIKEELIKLVELKNIGKIRARKLFNEGIKTQKDIEEKSEIVVRIIGEKNTEKITKKPLSFEEKKEKKEKKKKEKNQSTLFDFN